ncbi:MAG: heme ABC transporter permease [Alphaproteobacteria bacterium HGW-Alphaproteobacteria-4]|jgi:hypothetical protein|nr:MAG: heme ABC transporter permease [Alphaproteobacteria bacterium HGW-Alphaproteobacteria-4]
MGAYHTVAIHFPIALWMVSSLAIFIRVATDGPLGQAMDRALKVFLVLGVLAGAVAWSLGISIWPWETISSTPMGRNHMMMASWSLAFFTLLAVTRFLQGDRIWQGASRWIMGLMALIGVILVGITGTLGGHLHGSYTEVAEWLRLAGWEVYSTFYVPDGTIWLMLGVAVVILGLAFLKLGKSEG